MDRVIRKYPFVRDVTVARGTGMKVDAAARARGDIGVNGFNGDGRLDHSQIQNYVIPTTVRVLLVEYEGARMGPDIENGVLPRIRQIVFTNGTIIDFRRRSGKYPNKQRIFVGAIVVGNARDCNRIGSWFDRIGCRTIHGVN